MYFANINDHFMLLSYIGVVSHGQGSEIRHNALLKVTYLEYLNTKIFRDQGYWSKTHQGFFYLKTTGFRDNGYPPALHRLEVIGILSFQGTKQMESFHDVSRHKCEVICNFSYLVTKVAILAAMFLE